MKDEDETKEQLIKELSKLRQRVAELETAEAEGKRAQKASRQREKWYEELWDEAPVAYHRLDTRGIIIEVNQTETKMLGFTKDEMVGKRIFEFILPEQRKEAEERLKRKLAGRDVPKHFHRIYVKKDGSKMYVSVDDRLERDSDGKVVGIRTTMVDISEQKRAEDALRGKTQLLKRTFDSLLDAVFIVQGETVEIMDCNRAASKIFGYRREEMIGRTTNFLHTDEAALEEFRRKLYPAVEKNGFLHLPEFRMRRKDGTVFPTEHSVVLLEDEQGKPIGWVSVVRDITEPKRAEEELRESEKKYSTLVESSLTGIYIDQDGKIVFANHRFAEIYGYPREALIGIETWRLVHPDDRPLTDKMREGRLRGEDVPAEYEARGLTKDGKTIWVNRRNTRIEYKGRPAILGNMVDITEQKRADEELRKTNEELKNFVDVVSHDLKNPIISIQGVCSRLVKKYQQKLGDEGQNYLDHIMASARRMDLLVSDLLALSSIGRVVSAFKNVSCVEIVKNVTSGLQHRLKDRGIELVVADNLPATMYCDGARISQVFDNLLINATKFMGNTEKPKVEIGYEDRGSHHRFYVRDNGIGIDPKYHRKVFEMFWRSKEMKDEEGTGLGLAIVERIVNNHGGRVWVESKPKTGSTFYFTIPKVIE